MQNRAVRHILTAARHEADHGVRHDPLRPTRIAVGPECATDGGAVSP
ncbi:MAG: hypothetical protein K2G86_03600 [Prevotella sp.]|nr:hypothetical protein [Prevotella sp.]